MDCSCSDNGTEFKGTDDHAFVKACRQHGIGQKFTRVNRPQTSGKAEPVSAHMIDMWHSKIHFKDSADRRIQLLRFINFYNTVKPRKSLNNATPYKIPFAYFNQPLYKQP
ncbi:integrase core domain-containing protein [Nitrosomonas sp.]|uniref:integrase core domain-containing protein n=1 Tax=Nitrosomonas sp. TaxID=42353 RepID=UPI0032EE8E84